MAIEAQAVIACARGWIGTPYRHQASLRGIGCDCLGLLRGVWRELRGDEPQGIPAYAPDWSDATGGENLRDGLAAHLDAVTLDTLTPGDVLLFAMLKGVPARHCGILAARDGAATLIHARQNRRVSEEAFTPAWARRLRYGYRLRGFARGQSRC